ARDFFSELIKDSQAPHAGFLAEREHWLHSVQVEGREELIFEFEMLLRGVERYFNLHNLPIDARKPVVVRDFHDEMYDVRDALNEGIRIARRLLDPDSDQKMQFRHYVESQLADDRVRRAMLDDELEQGTPQESLFLLRATFESLRSVIDHLLKLEVFSFSLYTEVGNLALREIVLNRFFRPFRSLEFRLEYDRIKSVPVLEALRAIPEADRRLFTVAFLALFRLLHYLSYVNPDQKVAPAPRSRVVLALVRSEAVSLVGYLKAELAPRASQKRHRAVALRAARDVAKENDRIHQDLLDDNVGHEAGAPLLAAVELTQLFRRQLVLLARSMDPKLGGADFDRLVSRVDMAERLRLDLWAFAEICRQADAALRGTDVRAAGRALARVREYSTYFQDVSYQLLRYGDYEAFDRFTAIVVETEAPPHGPGARDRLAEDCRMFAEVCATMSSAVGRRSELAHRRLDRERATNLVGRFAGP
ncbi:MAG TPA: hypothetical protein VH208_13525, partial [Myxococcaceae bacterium]|nr:hypothetical protein [Myxococcaceae bacterium]